MPPKKSSTLSIKLPVDSIQVATDRQRQELGDIETLAESLQRSGLINPIVIDANHNLIAGERRLRAAQHLGWKDIDVRYFNDLTPAQAEIVELDENLHRSNLTWQEHAKAVIRLHRLLAAQNEKWSQELTASTIGMSGRQVSRAITVAKVLEDSPDKIERCENLQGAYNTIQRFQQRAAQKEISKTEDVLSSTVKDIFTGDQPVAVPEPSDETHDEHDDPILCADFVNWAADYDGEPFNFIHCDFPYGINLHDSDQAGHERRDIYEDTEATYWRLLDALAAHQHNLISPSAHVMFWFSMTYYTQTMRYFREHFPNAVVQPFPLVWHKSDNVGIMPDARRQPRRIYETALIMSFGDRHIVRAVGNAYSGPSGKASEGHLSAKPQPMLRHFFQMFVDETSRVLDPTCGGGNALAVAEEMKAEKILGIELDPDHFDTALETIEKGRRYQRMGNILGDD